jgi:hypothetical protein
VVAEDQPHCTVCGVAVTWHQGMCLHVTEGRLDRMLREPYPHDATVEAQPEG